MGVYLSLIPIIPVLFIHIYMFLFFLNFTCRSIRLFAVSHVVYYCDLDFLIELDNQIQLCPIPVLKGQHLTCFKCVVDPTQLIQIV